MVAVLLWLTCSFTGRSRGLPSASRCPKSWGRGSARQTDPVSVGWAFQREGRGSRGRLKETYRIVGVMSGNSQCKGAEEGPAWCGGRNSLGAGVAGAG